MTREEIILSQESVDDLERILKDRSVIQILVLQSGHVARRIDVRNDGTVTLGKYKAAWRNWLFREEMVLSFSDISFQLMQIFSNKINEDTSTRVRENRISSMFEEWFKAAIQQKDYNLAVRRLFYCYYMGYRNPSDLNETIVPVNTTGVSKTAMLKGILLKSGGDTAVMLDLEEGGFRKFTR